MIIAGTDALLSARDLKRLVTRACSDWLRARRTAIEAEISPLLSRPQNPSREARNRAGYLHDFAE